MCQIDSPDANFEEAKVNSVKLCPKNISLIISKKNNDFDPINGKIKINGDGARMTRNSNFILLSFPILQTRESVMSDKGNRTLGIVNGSQSYLIFFKGGGLGNQHCYILNSTSMIVLRED